MKQLIALFIVVSLSVPSWAGINDVLEKQKNKEQEELSSQQLEKAKHNRFLEFFALVTGIVEELQKKGVNFKTWPSKSLSDNDVANEFREAGWNVNVPVKDIRRYHKDKKTVVLAGGPAPLLASKLNDKVVLLGSYIVKGSGYIIFGTPDRFVITEEGEEAGDEASEILVTLMWTEETKGDPVKTQLPVFGDTLKSKHDEIRDDILRLLGGDVDALLEIQRRKEHDEKREKDIKARFREVFGEVASVVEELQNKGVKFKSYSKDIFISRRDGKKYARESNCPITASKLNDKVMLRDCAAYSEGAEFFFKPVDGNEITIKYEIEESEHPENLIVKMYTDEKTVEMAIPIFDSSAVKKERKTIRENIVSMVESSMGQ